MERETRFELATPTLARLCSTTELFPLYCRTCNYTPAAAPVKRGEKPKRDYAGLCGIKRDFCPEKPN